MNIWKFFYAISREGAFANPLSEAKVDEMVELLRLPGGERVLDIACGNGEFLLRVARRWGVTGVGVEISPYAAGEARERLSAAGLSDAIAVVEGDGGAYGAPVESFGLASCLGASWIWGGHEGTLRALARWTKPGGLILVGEPFWRRKPSPEYLATTNRTADAQGSHVENVATGTDLGLRFLHSIVSSEDDWDRYEGLHMLSAERYALAHPDDPDVPEILDRVRPFMHDYLRWGRDEQGWALYLFMKPAA